MDTLDMMKQAKIDGKTYQGEHGILYNVVSGFTVQTGRELRMIDIPADYMNEFFVWQWERVQTITKAEAEQKLGVKIVG